MGWLRSSAGALLVGVLSCGGRAADELLEPPPAAPPPYSSTPSPARPARPLPAPTPPPSVAPPGVAPPGPTQPSVGLAEAVVENILADHCGACHGPPLTPQQAFGDIWFISDVEELTERGYIVPLRSAESRIVQVMRDGTMPPSASGLERVSSAEIDMVARFIDDPRLWPVAQPRPALDAGPPLPADAGADGG